MPRYVRQTQACWRSEGKAYFANKHSLALRTSSACSSQRNLMVQSTTSLSSSTFKSDGNTRLLLFARTPSTLTYVSYTRLHFFLSSAFLNLSAMRIHSFDFQHICTYFFITHSSQYPYFSLRILYKNSRSFIFKNPN